MRIAITGTKNQLFQRLLYNMFMFMNKEQEICAYVTENVIVAIGRKQAHVSIPQLRAVLVIRNRKS